MNKRERNLLIAAVLLALVTLPMWPIWGGGNNTGELGITEESTERFESLKEQQADLPRLDLSQLSAEKQAFTGTSRNLFEYGSLETPEPPDEEPVIEEEPEETGDPLMVEEAPVVEERPVRKKPRLSGYEYYGFYESNEKFYAVFQWRDQFFVGAVNDIINETFRIESIDDKNVKIFVLNGEYNQTLKLPAPAGPEGVN